MKFKLFISTILVALVGVFLLLPMEGQGNQSSKPKPKQMALYVSNSVANTITKYDAETGALIGTVVQGGPELQAPNGFVIAPDGSIYVSGEESNNIVHYSKTGQLLEVIDPSNLADVSGPQGMSFGPDGLLYVVSQNNDKVVRYDTSKKKYQDKFCDVALPSVETTTPINADFGADGQLYVGTYSGHKQLKYQGPAKKASAISIGAAVSALNAPAPGTLLAVFDSPPSSSLSRAAREGMLSHRAAVLENDIAYASGDFASYAATQSAQTADGSLAPAPTTQHYYVDIIDTNTFTGYVAEYTTDGQYVRTFIPNGSGGLVLPGGIAFGPDGALYVANILVDENFNDVGSTIMRYDGQTGAPLGTFVAAGNGLGVPFAMRFGPK
jgi:sugar lactone lactonase YvrE